MFNDHSLQVREIAEALASTDDENAGAGTEQGAARNCGTFLVELTKELPKEMTGAIATIQPYLESDEVCNFIQMKNL